MIRFAKVKAGHDKNHLYYVENETENFVFLVNGTTKKMEHPKKKNKRHVQVIKDLPDVVVELFQKNEIDNQLIRQAIVTYCQIVDSKELQEEN